MLVLAAYHVMPSAARITMLLAEQGQHYATLQAAGIDPKAGTLMATSNSPSKANAQQRVESPHPSVSVDVVILTLVDGELRVLLVKRRTWPFEGMWAIPGGFIHLDEGIEDAARRELQAETSVSDIFLEQLYTFGDPGRDPRGRVITVVYYALIDAARLNITTTAEAGDARWYALFDLPPLAFDHARILTYALERLQGKLEYTTIGFQLLAPEFTLSELQAVYEAILHRKLDKRNFRKKILSTSILEETDRTKMEGPHRPARLYRFRPNAAR